MLSDSALVAIEVPAGVTRALRMPVIAGLVLLLVYAALSLAMDPNGYLGTDTGAKVATLEVMTQNGTADPDVGYWAADQDPGGGLHPLYQAARRADGGWVAVTTLPMIELARPLYDLGGYRAALVLPMLGAVATAFAARAVARRIGATSADEWRVFWVVSLASPVVVYGLDFWEHSIGLACMVGAVALLLDVADGRGLGRAAAAGVLLGASAVLRNETFVYAAVMVGVACAVRWVRSRTLGPAVAAGVLSIVGFAGPWLGNLALESAVGASASATRGARATSTAQAVGSAFDVRVREGLQTLFGTNRGGFTESVLLGVCLVALVLAALRADARADRRPALLLMSLAVVVYALALSDGPGFLPGLFVAFPVAVASLLQGLWRPRARLVLLIALAALPLVYLFQYTGGAAPQWGGRYTLSSAILLGVAGVVGLLDRSPVAGRALIALSAAVTVAGVVWLGVRSRGVEDFFDEVVVEAEPVLISRNAFLLREGGAVSVGRRWLSVASDDDFAAAVDVAREVGERRVSVLEWGAAAPPASALPPGLREVRRAELTFVDVPVGLVTYELTG